MIINLILKKKYNKMTFVYHFVKKNIPTLFIQNNFENLKQIKYILKNNQHLS